MGTKDMDPACATAPTCTCQMHGTPAIMCVYWLTPSPEPPVVWTPQDLDQLDARIASLKQLTNVTTLLGFNEPDQAVALKSSTSATYAAQLWYRFEAIAAKYNLTLGSPAAGGRAAWVDEWFRVRGARMTGSGGQGAWACMLRKAVAGASCGHEPQGIGWLC